MQRYVLYLIINCTSQVSDFNLHKIINYVQWPIIIFRVKQQPTQNRSQRARMLTDAHM